MIRGKKYYSKLFEMDNYNRKLREDVMLKIHFLNVGHGDSAIIELPERTMMIDINNGQALDESTKNELMESFSISPIDLIFKVRVKL